MALVVNRGHRGLDTLAGIVSRLLGPNEMPVDLYVYGVQDGHNFDIFVDNTIERAKHIVHFIRKNTNYSIRLGLPTAPAQIPAIALNARVREHDHREAIAQILLFMLLVVNNKINCVFEAPQSPWTPRKGDYFGDHRGRVSVVHEVVSPEVFLTTAGREVSVYDVEPYHPAENGVFVRGIVDNQVVGQVREIKNGFAVVEANAFTLPPIDRRAITTTTTPLPVVPTTQTERFTVRVQELVVTAPRQ